jgi:diacylglycerol kinase (ATP)
MGNDHAQHFVAIVNPAAGGGRCGRHAEAELNRLRESGLQVEMRTTSSPGDGTVLVRNAYAEGYRNFIAVGGDGTCFEVLNGLFPEALNASTRVSIGFLPLGTGNSFLRDFTDDGAEYSFQSLVEGKRRPCDVIQLTHRDGVLHFMNLMSLGFVAEVGALTNRRFKRLGQFGYILGVLSKVARLQSSSFPMRVDDGAVEGDEVTFISVNNSRYTGGKMMMAPNADISDGEADLIRVGEMGRFGLLRTFPKIFKGTHVDHPSASQSRVRTIDFDLSSEVDVMIDGEVLRLLPRRIEVLPRALDVRV